MYENEYVVNRGREREREGEKVSLNQNVVKKPRFMYKKGDTLNMLN